MVIPREVFGNINSQILDCINDGELNTIQKVLGLGSFPFTREMHEGGGFSRKLRGDLVSLASWWQFKLNKFAAEFVEKKLFASFAKRVHKDGCKTKDDDNAASDETRGEGKEKDKEKESCDYAQMLAEEILAVDKQLLEVMKASKDLAGTTALVALVHRGKLVVANVGDSRGVICDTRSNAIPLSFDHKPQQLKEQKRIKQAGGFVAFNGVWRVAGILATSRALGDYPLKDRNLIIADPDVLTFDVADLGAQFMILASDGLWDTFSNEEAVAFVKKRLHEPDFGAKSLTMQAYQRGSLDNITVMVVTFPKAASSK